MNQLQWTGENNLEPTLHIDGQDAIIDGDDENLRFIQPC